MSKLLVGLLLIGATNVYAAGANELNYIRNNGCKIMANLVLFGSQGKEDNLTFDETIAKIKRNVRGYETITPEMAEIVARGYNGTERGTDAHDLEYVRCLDKYPIN